MVYVKQTWVNGSAGGTPISASRLLHIEQGIFDAGTGGTGTATTDAALLTTGTLADGRLPVGSNAATVSAKALTTSLTSEAATARAAEAQAVKLTGAQTIDGAKNFLVSPTVNGAVINSAVTKEFSIGGPLTVGTGTLRLYNPSGRTLTIQSVIVSVGVAPTGTTPLIVCVWKTGTTLWTTPANRPTFVAGAYLATVGAIGNPIWTVGQYLTVDVVQVGSTVAGSSLCVQVLAV
jgi:hypothetical protein